MKHVRSVIFGCSARRLDLDKCVAYNIVNSAVVWCILYFDYSLAYDLQFLGLGHGMSLLPKLVQLHTIIIGTDGRLSEKQGRLELTEAWTPI